MFTIAAIVAAAFGIGCIAVAVIGIVNNHFPFRPRRTGLGPRGDRTLDRDSEPVLFWITGVLLLALGIVMVGTAILVTVQLIRGRL